MSFPYVIWTLRRTGGTTLTSFINSLSEHPTVQHEPFNHDRKFGDVTTAWRKNRDLDELRSNIRQALSDRPLIKNCHELVPPELSHCLMEVATELGYRHVVLDRRAEVSRILSLELAKLTGVWGKNGSFNVYEKIEAGTLTLDPINIDEAIAHLQFCKVRRKAIAQQLEQGGHSYFEVFFEDVYSGNQAGREKVRELLRFLDIDFRSHPNFGPKLTNALLRTGQNSARVIDFVPNIEQAREALSRALTEAT